MKRGITMKKSMKLAISLFICGLMLLSGCANASTSLPGNLQSKAGQVSTINILAPDFFSQTYSEKAEQYKKDWLAEMSLRYGVKLNITSKTYIDGKSDISILSRIRDVLNGKDTFAGLLDIQSMQISSDTIDQLMPLDDYLVDNPIWKSLPEELKDAFKVDGYIYAIPANVFRTQYTRKINNEALKETGITVTDLQSFSKFAKAYTHSTGKAVLSSYYLEYLTDILNAFGLYNMSNLTNNPFSYDPTADCCVDFLTKGAAVDALEYLRELYQAGALYISFDDSVNVNKDFDDGVTCTYYFQYSNQENCTDIFTLNPKYPQIALTSVDGFAMTKDTPQPKETINQFLNMLLGSEESYLECWLGSPDTYILNSDGTITVKMPQNADGSFTYPLMPNLTGGLTDIFPYSNANVFFSENGVVGKGSETKAGKYNEQFTLLYDLFKKGLIVDVPSFYQTTVRNEIYTAINKDHSIDMLYRNCIKNAITSSKYTVQQVIDNYREEMLNLGGNQILDQINAAISKKTAYYYG